MLQINLAVLVPLGALMLGLGDRGMGLATAALAASIASHVLTDRTGWLRLNRNIANAMALAATVFAVSNFARTRDEQLIAIADLLIYLQLILMFQQKTVRIYWQLLVLSVLEVVVATALNSTMLFGLLLVVYLFAALAALGLLFILRESEPQTAVAAPAKPLNVAPFEPDAGRPPRRWPLVRGIEVLPATTDDLPSQMLGRGVFWRTTGLGLGTLVVALVGFLFLPRFGKTLAEGQQTMIGYNPSVKLGDLGPLLQNSELVMQVELLDRNGSFVTPASPPLLRGSVLNYYRHGEWKMLGPHGQNGARLTEAPQSRDLVRERITIQPMHESVLFCVYPPYTSDAPLSRRRVRYDVERQQLFRNSSDPPSLEYEVLTTGLGGGHQARIVPKVRSNEHDMGFLLQLPDQPPKPRDLMISPGPNPTANDRLTGLRALATKTIAEAKIPADNHYKKAKLLEHLLSTPPFEYTLDRGASDPSLDPIEDFITRNPRGHCEYFASALALMLRSQDIPARVVIGYHGGELSQSGTSYDVRQLNAHAWVEAYLSAEQIKNVPAHELPSGGVPSGEGAWLVLDPTPAQQIADQFAQGTFLSSIADFTDYVQVLWTTYVVGLNSERQDRVVYGPLSSLGHTLEDLVSNPKQAVGEMFSRLKLWLSGGGNSEEGFDWYVVGAILILLVAAYAAWRLLRMIVRSCWRLIRRDRTKTVARSQIEFYRRFEALLAKHGLRRTPHETQLELAGRAATHITATHGPTRAAALPANLVSAFYDVRFGRRPLDAPTTHRLEHALSELSRYLNGGRNLNGDKGQGAGDRGGDVRLANNSGSL